MHTKDFCFTCCLDDRFIIRLRQGVYVCWGVLQSAVCWKIGQQKMSREVIKQTHTHIHTKNTAPSRLWQILTGALHLFLTPGETHPSPWLVLHQTDTGHQSNPWYTCHLSSQIKHTLGQWLSNCVTQPHRSMEKWSKLFNSCGPGLLLQEWKDVAWIWKGNSEEFGKVTRQYSAAQWLVDS